MIRALATFIGFALIGDVVSRSLHLPIPGTVVGLLGLAATLLAIDAASKRRGKVGDAVHFADLQPLARGLIAAMGVMFVPAGVGVITEADALRRNALPIVVGLVGSTLISLWVTGAVLTWWLRRYGAPPEQSAR